MLILQGPNHPVEALTFAPDSVALYAVQGHHGIRAWNLADRTATRAECEGRLLVEQFLLDPEGQWALSRTAHTTPPDDTGTRIIDLTTKTMRPLRTEIRRNTATFLPGSQLVTLGFAAVPNERGSRTCLDRWQLTPTGPHHEARRELEWVTVTALTALGNRLATAEVRFRLDGLGPEEGRAQVRIRSADGEPEMSLAFPRSSIQQLFASPDGTLLVARYGANLHVWDATDWTRPPVNVFGAEGFSRVPSGACFHSSGRFLLLTNYTAAVRLFDTTTWQRDQAWDWKIGPLRAVAVSPDGTLAAAGSQTGAIVIWDLDL